MEWKESPVFKGSTKFDALPEVRNIMITGGAGFMYAGIIIPLLKRNKLAKDGYRASWLARHLTQTYPEYRICSFDKIDYCATLNNTRALDESNNFSF